MVIHGPSEVNPGGESKRRIGDEVKHHGDLGTTTRQPIRLMVHARLVFQAATLPDGQLSPHARRNHHRPRRTPFVRAGCRHHPVPGREARRCRHQHRPGATSIGDVIGEVMACDAARSQAEPNTSRDDGADDWADDASCPREPDAGCDADEAPRHRCDDTTVCKTCDGRDVPWACSTSVTRAAPASHQVAKPRRRRRRYELKDISGSWPPKSSRRPGRCQRMAA
jgi:hypothetical protein